MATRGDLVLVEQPDSYTYVYGRTESRDNYRLYTVAGVSRDGKVTKVKLEDGRVSPYLSDGRDVRKSRRWIVSTVPPELHAAVLAVFRDTDCRTLEQARAIIKPFTA